MTVRQRTRTTALSATAVALMAGGAALWASQATAAATYHDAAYGISASGAAPIGATPSVRSTDGQKRSDSGGAGSSDGTISIRSASVTAGGGRATAKVSGFSAFDGLVAASSVSANCDNGRVSSTADGTPAGKVGRNATVAYGVTSTNSDGSTTIIGMQVTITAGAGTEAARINVASATCGAAVGQPSPSRSAGPTGHPSDRPTSGTSPSAPVTTPTAGGPTATAGPTRGPGAGSGRRPTAAPTLPPAPVPSPGVANAPVTG